MQPVVISFSDDNITKETAIYLSESLDNCPIIETDSIQELMRITTHTLDAVFYVGHGSEEGIESKESMIEWSFIERAITQSPSNEHMILACNSENLNVEDTTKTWITFPGLIDARIASDVTLALHYLKTGDSVKSAGYGQLAMFGYFSKVVLGIEKQDYLGPVYDDGGGGSGSDYDFIYRGVFFDSYSVDPSHEIFYDHPSYETYFRLLGVGAPNSFQVGSGDDLVVDHIDRASIEFWKLGGAFTIAEFLVALGIALAFSIWGIVASGLVLVFAAILAGLGFTVAMIADILVEDELGGGWIFYKDINQGASSYVKLGMSWWFLCFEPGGVIPFPCDGRFIR